MKRLTVLLCLLLCFLVGCQAAPQAVSVGDTATGDTVSASMTSTTIQATDDVTAITLYRKEQMFTGEAERVKVIEDAAQIDGICKELSADVWKYYPDENGWVKCQPIFASYILVFAQENGEQTVLHIPYADNGYIAVGTFDGSMTYAEIFEAADTDRDKGVERFARYTVDKALIADLCALF